MRHDLLDRYSGLDSPIHRLPAAIKLGGALATVTVTVTLPAGAWNRLGLIALFVLGIAALSRIPSRFLVGRLLALEPLALGVAGLAIFQPNGGRIFATMLVKATLCLLTMILLSNTTAFSALLGVLERARVPRLLVTTLALMY